MSEKVDKRIPDFVDDRAWQRVEFSLDRSYWRSVKGNRVELFLSYWTLWMPIIVIDSDGKGQSFSGEDAIERAWTVAEMFRKQEQ